MRACVPCVCVCVCAFSCAVRMGKLLEVAARACINCNAKPKKLNRAPREVGGEHIQH